MELKYIWVEKYNSIESTGFNFSNKDNQAFSYNGGIVEIIEKDYFQNLLGGNITSVTAIAGENGSGKTSLCEIINYSLATVVNGTMGYSFPFKGVVIYGQDIYYCQDCLIENTSELKKLGFRLTAFKDTPLEAFFRENSDDSKHTHFKSGFIYYSHSLDLKNQLHEVNLENISTEFLLHEDDLNMFVHTTYGKKYANRGHRANREYVSNMQAHFIENSYRHTYFYLNFPDILESYRPKSFTIELTFPNLNKHLELINDDALSPECISYLQNFEVSILQIVYPYNEVYGKAKEKIILDDATIKLLLLRLYSLNILIRYLKLNLAEVEPDNLKIFDGFLDENIKQQNNYPQSFSSFKILKEKFINLLNCTSSNSLEATATALEIRGYNEWRYNLWTDFSIDNTEDNRSLLLDFIDFENKCIRTENRYYTRITNYYCSPNGSSGEKAFLNLFSRLFEIKNYIKVKDEFKEAFTLFIDEGELGFHPEWKRKFFYWLTDFLIKHMSEFSFQIIITSHSPYLLSDIPSNNVILLKKRQGRTVIEPTDEFKTFGANIHELLANSFFLNDGFMGEFAKKKIKLIIDRLYCDENSTELSEDIEILQIFPTLESTKSLIDLIGEPIIRERLIDIYNEKVGIDNQSDIVISLRSEIENLKSQLNMRSNLDNTQ